MTDLRSELRGFVVENFMYGQAAETLEDDASFIENGIIDSTGVLELIAFLEQHYRITMEPAELVPENLDSISNLMRLVGSKRPQAVLTPQGDPVPCK